MTAKAENTGARAADFWEPRRALTLDAARRHSMMVSVLRKVLMSFAGGLLLLLLYYFFNTGTTQIAPVNPDQSVTMVNPTYRGRTSDGLPYRLTADTTVRTIDTPDEVQLTNPVLHFLQSANAEESIILADSGIFNSEKQILELRKNVKLTTDDGNACTTSHARIFVEEKRAEGDERIDCTGNFGIAAGQAYEINDHYTEFVFKGGMVARINPKEANNAMTTDGLRRPEQQKQPAKTLSFGGNDPIDVIAQKATFKGPLTILTGNVDIKQGVAKINADKVDLHREELAPDAGGAKYGSLNKIVAVGHFKYSGKENTITGNKGVYEQDKNIITVTGNVVSNQNGKSTVDSEKMIYDLTRESIRFSGTCSGRNCKDGDRIIITTGN